MNSPTLGPDFKKKLATARSRDLGMSIMYQNIPQLQNRYPDGQWEEILGGCDTSLFLGCNDMTTATYFSGRSGEVTVGVASIRKNLSSMRMSDYVPDYSETSSVGKRMLLLPDEVLRFPLDQALVIIRGQKVLKVRKFDYSRHPEAKKLVLEKTESHVPEWRKGELENEDRENEFGEELGKRNQKDIFTLKADKSDDFPRKEEKKEPFADNEKDSKMASGAKGKMEDFIETQLWIDMAKEEESEPGLKKNAKTGEIERVEDLFTDEW